LSGQIPAERFLYRDRTHKLKGVKHLANILVVGSMNMDIVNTVQRHPLPGETISSLDTSYYPGGKGANQAVAATRAGGVVTMVGAVGQDSFGTKMVTHLKEAGVLTDCILKKGEQTGIAFITVDSSGENSIILSPGANGQLAVEDVKSMLTVLDTADAVLLQNEIPWETTQYVMREAKKRGVRVILNLAPAFQLSPEALSCVDVLILNEYEAEILSGLPVKTVSDAEQAARQMINQGAGSVIITLGEQGALHVNDEGSLHVPAFAVTPVDTTAAGDTFAGAFAVACLTKGSIAESLQFASAAAAITVTRKGAQSSIPDLAEIEAFLLATHS
jgi:ribokinase